MALGALVATDAGASSKLAWVGAGVGGFLVALGTAARSSTPVHFGVALLGAMLLLRQDARLVLASLYGAGLLLVAELGWRSIELAGVRAIGPRVISARAAAVLALAASGGCAGAGAAIAVTVAPGRSLALTAVGAIAVVTVFGAIARHARHRYRTTAGPDAEAKVDGMHLPGDGARSA